MLIFDKNEINDIEISQYAFYAFFINKNDYINILQYSENNFNISLIDKNTRQIELYGVPYMIYKKFIPIGLDKKLDNCTINILGKEVSLRISYIICNLHPGVEFIIGIVNLKNNWTCSTIPHIIFAKNPNIDNLTILNIINNSDKYIKLDFNQSIDAKLGLYNNTLNEKHLFNIPKKVEFNNSNIDKQKEIEKEKTKEKEETNNSSNNEVEEIVFLPNTNISKGRNNKNIDDNEEIYTGRNGAKYKIVDGKKRYLGKKTKKLYIAKT